MEFRDFREIRDFRENSENKLDCLAIVRLFGFRGYHRRWYNEK
jgi:hypothetical protein